MGLTAEDNNDFEIIPEDVYTARCYRVIDLGTQTSNWKGIEKQQHKVMVSWELIGDNDVRMKEGDNKGKPFSIHQRYTVSLSEKSLLREHLEAWRGKSFTAEELKGFDLKNVINSYCTIQVVHDETGKYANISSIMAYKGEKPQAVNTDIVFDIDEPDMKVFDSLSEKLKETIKKSPEWDKNATPPQPTKQPTKDDVVIEDIGDGEIDLDQIPF